MGAGRGGCCGWLGRLLCCVFCCRRNRFNVHLLILFICALVVGFYWHLLVLASREQALQGKMAPQTTASYSTWDQAEEESRPEAMFVLPDFCEDPEPPVTLETGTVSSAQSPWTSSQVGSSLVNNTETTDNNPDASSTGKPCVKYTGIYPRGRDGLMFNFTINPFYVCTHDQPDLLGYVYSAPSNHKHRMIIRQTWGNPAVSPDYNFKVIFILGQTLRPQVQSAIDYESAAYGDIVQANFLDTYYNLTLKAMAALEWTSAFCSNASYVLKIDDDMFLNTYSLVMRLQLKSRRGQEKRVVTCFLAPRARVIRQGKYAVTAEEFPGTHYPPFCLGPSYLMSIDVVKALYNASLVTPFFKLEDVYVTGFLAQKVGLKHTEANNNYFPQGDRGNALEFIMENKNHYRYVFSPIHNLNKMQRVWNALTRKVYPTGSSPENFRSAR